MLSGKMTSACLCVHAHVQALAMKRGDEETSKCKKQKSIISSSSHHWYFGDAKHKEFKLCPKGNREPLIVFKKELKK